jgi:integrase
MKPAAEFSKLLFETAAAEWLQERELSAQASTVRCYRDYIGRLKKFELFAGKTLEEIAANPWLLIAYQRDRKDKYHPASINHDCNTLLQILGRAGLRKQVEEHYRPLSVPDWSPPKVLSEQEEDAFFKLAASCTEWSMAYWVASLTNNTSASGKELRMLQLQNIHLDDDPPNFEVPRDMKNQHRPRRIPLNDTGRVQMERLVMRARELGSIRPHHYLFPFRDRISKRYDPDKPASQYWIYHQWGKMVHAALEQKIISFPITPHNLRHQIITKMLEDGQPEEVVRAIAGHVSRKIMEHYSHTRLERKDQVLRAIDKRLPQRNSRNSR